MCADYVGLFVQDDVLWEWDRLFTEVSSELQQELSRNASPVGTGDNTLVALPPVCHGIYCVSLCFLVGL